MLNVFYYTCTLNTVWIQCGLSIFNCSKIWRWFYRKSSGPFMKTCVISRSYWSLYILTYCQTEVYWIYIAWITSNTLAENSEIFGCKKIIQKSHSVLILKGINNELRHDSFFIMSTLKLQNGMQIMKGFFKTKLSFKIYLEVDLITSFIAERPLFYGLDFF